MNIIDRVRNNHKLDYGKAEDERIDILREELKATWASLPTSVTNKSRSGENVAAMMSGSELPSAFVLMRLSDEDFKTYSHACALADTIRKMELGIIY